jgi:phage tail-like protein
MADGQSAPEPPPDPLSPLHVFNFVVTFREEGLDPNQAQPPSAPDAGLGLCSGAFSECSGLEATMEPAVIREGGRNYGDLQRPGRVTFGTIILKRGITTVRDLWRWWALVNGGGYAYRLRATIELRESALRRPPPPSAASRIVRGAQSTPSWYWVLRRCLPVKMKFPDLNAMGNEVGIEELHLAHEGLLVVDAQGQVIV